MVSYKYEFITDRNRLPAIAQEISQAKILGEDLETTGLSPLSSDIRVWSINTGANNYVIDVRKTGQPDPIIQAHKDNREAVVVGQNCLDGDMQITLGDGTKKRIADMVKERHPGPVVCINETTGGLETKPVIGWIDAGKRVWEDWYRIRVRGKGCLWLTKDHQVLTTKGRKQAGDIVIGDRIYTQKESFTPQQQDLIYGSLLGDASIVMQEGSKARTPYFLVAHSIKRQSAYADFKAMLLESIGVTVKDTKPATRGFGAKSGVILRVVRTKSDARFLKPFYDTKKLGTDWINNLTIPALAIWFGDDGSSHGYKASFCVDAYGDEGADLLVTFLKSKGYPASWYLRAPIENGNPEGNRYLEIKGSNDDETVTKFWSDIAPFVPTCVAYKLPDKYQHLASDSYWIAPKTTHKAWADEVVEVGPLTRIEGDTRRHGGKKKVGRTNHQFCLTVEGNANFMASGLSVSNCKFDQKFVLYHYGLELPKVFDTFRASNLMWNGRGMGHNLYDIYRRELNRAPETQDLGGAGWDQHELTTEQVEYAAEDTAFLPAIREVMIPKLQKLGLVRIAKIEFDAILAEAAVELNGIFLNSKDMRELLTNIKIKHDSLQEYLLSTLPDPSKQLLLPGFKVGWNLDSPAQMLQSLLQLGIKQKIKDPETYRTSIVPLQDTMETTLAMIGDKYPVISKILEYRETATQLKMFGYPERQTEDAHIEYFNWINQHTGRLHPEYFPFLLAGRYSCSKPNLSQIPRGKKFRECFQAAPGYTYVLCDFSNIEMCIVAEVANDEVLIKVFVDGEDAHYYTATVMTGKPKDQITKAERQSSKPVNFGFCYGMQAPKLVVYAKSNYGVTMTEKEAVAYRKKYFDRFEGIRRWHDRAQREGQASKMARSIGGRLRYLDNGKFFNEFFNTPVQSTGADGLKAALRCCYERFKKLLGGRPPARIKGMPTPDIQMIHHVHDEILTECKEQDPEFVEAVKVEQEKGMVEGMQQFLRRVPVKAEATTGRNWGCKG